MPHAYAPISSQHARTPSDRLLLRLLSQSTHPNACDQQPRHSRDSVQVRALCALAHGAAHPEVFVQRGVVLIILWHGCCCCCAAAAAAAANSCCCALLLLALLPIPLPLLLGRGGAILLPLAALLLLLFSGCGLLSPGIATLFHLIPSTLHRACDRTVLRKLLEVKGLNGQSGLLGCLPKSRIDPE